MLLCHFKVPLSGNPPVSPAASQAFEQQVAANPQGKHGKHEYALEEYGLDPDQVRERFAAYIERFQISA